MRNKTILVETESWNLWWGIYGLSKKSGWEDIFLSLENGKRIAAVCLLTKEMLKSSIADLLEYPEDKDYVEAIQKHLSEDKCHYWYYYSEKESEDFCEVSFDAPKNEFGVKPCTIEIWLPCDGLDIESISLGVKKFAKDFLKLKDCDVKITTTETVESALKSYTESEKDIKLENIVFGENVVKSLSKSWGISEEKTLERLYKSVK
ncbi:hypothetical protein [Aureispira anguillae]|uniref:hypothetical protein n=1 Tax=Aureispira anguillae TaxID=2864201 RepID=UPI002230AC11|nr:hypothetical protein [Aureispira anguillae]